MDEKQRKIRGNFPQLRKVVRNKQYKKKKFGDLLYLAEQVEARRRENVRFLNSYDPIE